MGTVIVVVIASVFGLYVLGSAALAVLWAAKNRIEALGVVLAGLAIYGGWWLWPLTGIVLGIPAAIVARVRWRRPMRSEDVPLVVAVAVAALSGACIVYQVIAHGLPTAWWLAGALAGLAAARLASRRARDATKWTHKLLGSVQRSLIAAIAGLALVVGTQVALAYRTDTTPEQVKAWIDALADLRIWLRDVVWLGPVKLAVLLVALIAVTMIVAPSLQLVRSYQRVARAASLCLLCVTVATSFTFFTARHLDRWEGAWVASRGDVLDKDLAELDANRRDVVRLAAIEDAVDSLPERARAELRALAAEVEQYPAGERRDVREAREAAELNRAIIDRTEALIAETRPSGKPRAEPAPVAAHGPDRELMWERVTEELASGVQITAMTERASTGTAVLEQVPGDPNERSHRQAIERLQAQRSGAPGAPPRFTDLDVLGVERTRARAAREEAYHSTKLVVLSALIPRDGLADLFIQHMLTRIDVKPGAFTGFVDRRRARGAMNQRPPATWHPEIGTALGAARPARGSLVTGVEQRVTTARGRAATDRAQEIERTASSNARAYHEQQLPKRRGGKFGEPEEATERESESLRDIREPHVP